MAKLKDLIKKYKNDIASVAVISAGSIATLVSSRTPVQVQDGGSLRASWTPSINAPQIHNVQIATGSERFNNTFSGPSQLKTYKVYGGMAKVATNDWTRHNPIDVVNKMDIGDTFYYTNGQPYAYRIEYEQWSDQTATYAPFGMMRSSIAEWDRIVNDAIKVVKK